MLVRTVVAPPSFDFTSGAVVWSEATDGAAPDAVTTLIEASRTAESRNWNWLVIAPHTPEKLVLPRLPTDVADWTPMAGDDGFIDHVGLVKLTGGYDALRTHDIDVGDNSDLALISGAAGRIALFNSVDSTGLQGRRGTSK